MKKILKIALIVIASIFFALQANFVSAENLTLRPSLSEAKKFNAPTYAGATLLPNNPKELGDALASKIKQKLKNGAFYMLGIESKIKNSQEELQMLKDNRRVLRKRINESNVEIDKLESQLKNLDKLIAANRERLYAGELMLAQYQNSIYLMEDEIKQKEKELNTQIESLDKALTTYYLHANIFFDSDQPTLLAFLSSDLSTGEILKQNEYLFFLQNAGQELSARIIKTQQELDERLSLLNLKREKASELQQMLTQEKQHLTDVQNSKKRLLDETKGKQTIYETLLELSKKEEAQVALEIQRLKENYEFFDAKLKELKENPEIPSYDFNEEEILSDRDKQLAWPVSPALGLTAFFRDTEYKRTLGVEHNAVDIRLPSGSKVRAAADGVITKAADNGFAYSYVIIGHQNGFMTLYGHLSEIYVKEGETVRQGQVIGLSGGIPGTKGAGWLTTGAHLHLEVFKNFQYVDPLDYLPLEYVPVTSLPKKYLDELTGEETEKIKRLK